MILWDVDTQVDFLAPEGRLYVPGAESIIGNLARLTAYARDQHILLVSSACAHHPGDPELETYGPHCMAGTPGQEKVPQTLLPTRYIVPNRPVELPDLKSFQQIIIEKQQFDVFTNPNTVNILRQVEAAGRIVLYGVVTEICVACTASGLLDRGYGVTLVRDAVYALDAPKADAFVQELLRRGGKLTTTDEVLGSKTPDQLAVG
jgi:nicotinamidase/pyrazinamidase